MSRLGDSLARSLYRVLLLAYPREFRDYNGAEVCEVFVEACRDSRRRDGIGKVLRRLLAAVVEVPRGGLRERWGSGGAPRPQRSRRAAIARALAELASDARFAARSLRRRPGWTMAIIATLALGIGANTAIFSVIDATLLAGSPWPDADRLVYVNARFSNGTSINPEVDELFRWQREIDAFERFEARAGVVATLSHAEGARRVSVAWVTTGYLDALGIEPIAGRFLRADDARPDAQPVAVMPEVTWRRLYGADDDVVGGVVELDGVAHVVVGIAPSVQDITEVFHVALPAPGAAAREPRARRARGIAWLRPGVSIEEASVQLVAVSAGEDERWGPYTGQLHRPGNEFWQIEEFRSGLLALTVAVFLVLAIACVNVANLLLAAAETRRGELAVRAALGAGRARLARFLLTESLVLSILGGALGVAVAFGAIALMRLAPPSGQLGDALGHVRVDGTVLAYATSIAVFAGLAFGLVPALRSTAGRHRGALQQADARAGGGRSRLRRAMVAAETALSLVLLVAAGLTVRSFVEVRFTDPGFDADRIMAVGIRLPTTRYAEPSSQRAFFDALSAQARQIPGVQAVSLGYGATPPSDLVTGGEMTIDGREGPIEEVWATVSSVEGGFLDFMGIPLLAGRDLTAADVRGVKSAAERPVVINRAMAERYWPDGDAVGARFTLSLDYDQRWNRVVGIAGNVAQRGLEVSQGGLHMYWPMAFDGRYSELLVRLHPGVPPPVAALRDVINRLDPQIPTDGVETASAALLDSMSGTRFRAALFGVFGAVALALAAVGIFGVVAYTVVQRTAEMGVRLALGATPGVVRRLVVVQGALPVLAGIVAGLLLALGAARLMAGFLLRVPPLDPLTFITTAVSLLVVGLLATWVPARRATTVDPVTTLRRQ